MWDVDFEGRLPVGDWFPLRFRSLVAQKWRDEVACLILRSPRHSQIYLQELDMIVFFFLSGCSAWILLGYVHMEARVT